MSFSADMEDEMEEVEFCSDTSNIQDEIEREEMDEAGPESGKFSSEDVWLSKYPLFSTEYGKALHVGKISMQGFPAANALHGKFSDVQGFPDI